LSIDTARYREASRAGRNVVSIRATHGKLGSAGLITRIHHRPVGSVAGGFNPQWKCSADVVMGWEVATFDDAAWADAVPQTGMLREAQSRDLSRMNPWKAACPVSA